MGLGQNKIIFFGLLLFTFVWVGNIFAQNEDVGGKSVNFPYSRNPKTTISKNEPKNQSDKTSKDTNEVKDATKNNAVVEKSETDSEDEKTGKKSNIEENKVSEETTKKTSIDDSKDEKNKSPEEGLEKVESDSEIGKTNPVGSTENVNDESGQFESRSIANKTLEIVERESKKAISPTEIYKIGVGDILFISLQNAPPNVSTYFTVLNNGAIDYPLAGGMNFVLGLTQDEIEAQLEEKHQIV